MSVDTAPFDIADAFGTDFTYLAPPGERRFDPASVAVALSGMILHAVYLGIAGGIQEHTKNATVSVLDRIGGQVRTALSAVRRRAFDRNEPASIEQVQQETTEAAGDARLAASTIDPATREAVISAAADTVEAELIAAGLPARPATRVRAAVIRAVTDALAGAPLR